MKSSPSFRNRTRVSTVEPVTTLLSHNSCQIYVGKRNIIRHSLLLLWIQYADSQTVDTITLNVILQFFTKSV